jgi:hypothetical protein
VDDFLANSDDARRAFNAVTAVDSLAAHIYWWCEGNSPAAVAGIADDIGYRQKLAIREPDFRLLRDMAKASKHVKLHKFDPLVSGMSSLRPFDPFGPQRGKIMVAVKGAGTRPVDEVVKKCLGLLEGEISLLSIP